jgi:hypothetical protein
MSKHEFVKTIKSLEKQLKHIRLEYKKSKRGLK